MNAASVGTAEFYVTGGTLRRDAESYVVRRADQDLYESLREGKLCYVLTTRQMGKSSLMVRTAWRLRREGASVVVIDLTALGHNVTLEQWYGGLVSRLGSTLDLEDELESFRREKVRWSPLQRWTGALTDVLLPRVQGKLVIFVDELDAVRSLPFPTDELFAAIRELYNRRTTAPDLERLSFCLLGVATPSDLIRDVNTTPFNIGRRIDLDDFTEEEALPLVRGLERGEKAAEALLSRVLYWTRGHPYLTQRLCRAIAENAAIVDEVGVDTVCDALFFNRRPKEQDDNLAFVRERILRGGSDVAALLSLYADVRRDRRVTDDEADPRVSALRLAGIVRGKEGRLEIRNRVYERVFDPAWIEESMPGAELRRQKAAYRRGFPRAAAIAAVIVAVVGSLAFFAFVQRERAREQETRSRRLIYAAEMTLAQQALDAMNPGRAGALLRSHIPRPGEPAEEDLRGFEWHYLFRLWRGDPLALQHEESVNALAFSPDGAILASASRDRSVKLWDVAGLREIRTLRGHTGPIRSVFFSPDGRTLSSGSEDETVRLWNVADGRLLHVLRAEPTATVGFSPDGKTLMNASGRSVKNWDVASGAALGTSATTFWIDSADMSPDGSLLALGSRRGAVELWNVVTREAHPLLRVHSDRIFPRFSPDGATLATASRLDGSLVLWNVASREVIRELHFPSVRALEFSPDGETLAVALQSSTVLLRVPDGLEVARWEIPADYFAALAFSPDGNLLAHGGLGGTVRLWDVRARRLVSRGEPVATGDTAYNLPREKQTPGRWLSAMAFSQNGLILAGSEDRVVNLWDVSAGSKRQAFEAQARIRALAFSPDGTMLAFGGEDASVRLWSLIDNREVMTLRGHSNDVNSLAFFPDATTLASGSEDLSVKLWNVQNGVERASLTGHGDSVDAVAVSPDGKTLASKSQNTLRFWNAATGREVTTLRSVWGHTHMQIGFSPDGAILADAFGLAHLWDVASRTRRAALDRGAYSLAFSPDSARLATGSFDGGVSLWDVGRPARSSSRSRETPEWYARSFFHPTGGRSPPRVATARSGSGGRQRTMSFRKR